MPTIIRFVTTLVVLAAIFGAVVFYLGNFIEPRMREMTVRIPSSHLNPKPVKTVPTPLSPATAAGDSGSETGTVAP